MKSGGSFRFVQYNRRGGTRLNGDFTFDGSETGSHFADYLLVPVATIPESSAQQDDYRIKDYGVYAQDSYKLRSK